MVRAHRRAARQAAGPHHPRADPRLRVRPHPAQPRCSGTSRCGSTRAWPTTMRGTWDPSTSMTDPRRRGHRPDPKLCRSTEYRGFSTRASSTTSATPPSSSWRPASARRASGSSSTRCARTSWAAGMEDIYQQAFRMKPEEFDEAVREVAEGALQALPRQAAAERLRQATSRPNHEKTPFTQVFAFSPSPSGEMVAALTGNRGGRRGGRRAALGPGRRGDPQPHQRLHRASSRTSPSHDEFVAGRSIGFDPAGRHGRLLRAHEQAAQPAILVSVLDGRRHAPRPGRARPGAGSLPAARRPPRALRRACKDGVSDIFMLDLRRARSKNLTAGRVRRRRSPDLAGRQAWSSTRRRISGHDKIYSFPLDNPSQQDPAHLRRPTTTTRPPSPRTGTRSTYSSDRGRRHLQPAQPRPAHRA